VPTAAVGTALVAVASTVDCGVGLGMGVLVGTGVSLGRAIAVFVNWTATVWAT